MEAGFGPLLAAVKAAGRVVCTSTQLPARPQGLENRVPMAFPAPKSSVPAALGT